MPPVRAHLGKMKSASVLRRSMTPRWPKAFCRFNPGPKRR